MENFTRVSGQFNFSFSHKEGVFVKQELAVFSTGDDTFDDSEKGKQRGVYSQFKNQSMIDKKRAQLDSDFRDYDYKNKWLRYYCDNGNLLICHNVGYYTDEEFGKFPVCRQIAFHWLMVVNRNDHNYHESFRTKEQLVDTISSNYYDQHCIAHKGDEYVFFSFGSLGLELYNLCKDMINGEEKFMTIMSETHVMALIVNCYSSHVVVKFYDPNKTTVHLRLVSNQLVDLKALTMQYVLQTEVSKYFSQISVGLIIVYNNPNEDFRVKELHDDSVISEENIFGGGSSVYNLSDKLFFLMYFGFGDLIKKVTKQILESKLISRQEKMELLLAKNVRGYPALWVGFSEQHYHSVLSFLEFILYEDSFLSSRERVNLILAKNASEIAGVFSLVPVMNFKIIKMYISLIIGAKSISIQEKCKLFSAKLGSGESIFAYAVANEYIDFANVIAESILPHKDMFSSYQLSQLFDLSNCDRLKIKKFQELNPAILANLGFLYPNLGIYRDTTSNKKTACCTIL